MTEPHSPSFIELKKYLDERCVELKLIPISDATIKILDDNEVDSSVLDGYDEVGLAKMSIPSGPIKKLLRIIDYDKANPTAANKNKNPNNNNNAAESNNLQSASNSNLNGGNSNSNNNNNNNNNNNSNSTKNQVIKNEETNALLQQLSEASDFAAFKVATNKMKHGMSAKFYHDDLKRIVDIVTAKVAFLDADESLSESIGWSIVNIIARVPDEHSSFKSDEKLLNLAYDRVMNAQHDETKIRWLNVVTNVWVSLHKANNNNNKTMQDDQYYTNICRKFAPIAVELMKKKSFDLSAHSEAGEDEILRCLMTQWNFFIQHYIHVRSKVQQEGGTIQPLFDFASLQLLLENGGTRADLTQETLTLLLGTASMIVAICIETCTIDVEVIANSIHRCLEKCTSPACVTKMIEMLYMLFHRSALRAQMGKHLGCEEIVKKFKASSSQNAKVKEMIVFFEAIHQKKLKESLEQLFGTVGATASSGLIDVLAKANVDGKYLSSLKKNELHRLPIYDHKVQKELEDYIDRLAAIPSSPIVARLVAKGFPSRLILQPTDVVITTNEIGEGTNGKLFRASIIATGEVCAAKVFSKDEVGLSEAENYSRLSRFDFVTRLLGVTTRPADGTTPERIVLLLELAEQSLWHLLKARTTSLPVATVLAFATQIAKGLAYLHGPDETTGKQRNYHLDIKPSNILAFPSGNLKLVDFGSIVNTNRTVTDKTLVYGTPLYLPPEYFDAIDRGVKFQPAATFDIFSFGIVLLDLMSKPKQTPEILNKIANRQLERHNHQPCFLDFAVLEELLAPEVLATPDGMKLIEICKKCLMVDPKLRPQNGMELVSGLLEAAVEGQRNAVELTLPNPQIDSVRESVPSNTSRQSNFDSANESPNGTSKQDGALPTGGH